LNENDLKTLITDPRFSEMRKLLDNVREELISHVSHQGTAMDHGALAHSSGGIDCINHINNRLKAIEDKVDDD